MAPGFSTSSARRVKPAEKQGRDSSQNSSGPAEPAPGIRGGCFVPNVRSPASPRSGRMQPFSFGRSSRDAVTTGTSGCASFIRATPSGAASRQRKCTSVAACPSVTSRWPLLPWENSRAAARESGWHDARTGGIQGGYSRENCPESNVLARTILKSLESHRHFVNCS